MTVLSLRISIIRLFNRFRKDIIKTSKSKSSVPNGATSSKNALQERAGEIASEFDFDSRDLNLAVKEFIAQLDQGLRTHGSSMEQIPSYITSVPTGYEQGTYLAVDLGGTNLRVCSVALNGDGTYSVKQSKLQIPVEVMVSAASRGLFQFVAQQIEQFLRQNHAKEIATHRNDSNEVKDFKLGFTFSHAVTQQNINSGVLIRWSKGFSIDDAVGQDVCVLLQQEISELGLPVQVTALVNDTVGTLMARAYSSPENSNTILGAVFGTGTNGAYIETLPAITKLVGTGVEYEPEATHMIVNTEWGNFDSKLEVLPSTAYDIALDAASVNPGFEMYEKRISGMYLGELLRLAIVSFLEDPKVVQSTELNIPVTSPVYRKWRIDSEVLSAIKSDTDPALKKTTSLLASLLESPQISADIARATKLIADAIGRRSARLSAIAIGAIVLQTRSLEDSTRTIDIGVDGSLIEFYPGFEGEIRGALRDIDGIGIEGEKRIYIALAQDGSGVGAALTAHMTALHD
ncbi:hexokinase [Phlyctema vagabunda]|uniref:Phosphotransferase n=1 Tax=Phlyctema vagabunda TaxID=108571 RepID=A0ABR4PIG0_9HELO